MRNKRFYRVEINITRSVLKTLEKRLKTKQVSIEDQFISLVVKAWRNGKNRLEVSLKENSDE